MRQVLRCASVWERILWNTALSTEFRNLSIGIEVKINLYLYSTTKTKYLRHCSKSIFCCSFNSLKSLAPLPWFQTFPSWGFMKIQLDSF